MTHQDAPSSEALFVYGTLRHDDYHEMFHVLARHGRFAGEAVLNARLFDLGDYPGAVLSDAPGDLVRGEVYQLAQPAAVLSELDHYEGCGPDDPEPTEFKRAIVEVTFESGARARTWTYLYNRGTGGLKRIVPGDYLAFKRDTGAGA